jgi:hypothetical protein
MASGQMILVASKAVPGLLQRVWAEMDYWLDISYVTTGREVQHLQGTQEKTWRVSLSICRSHITILSTIQVHQFYGMCQGIMNNCIIRIVELQTKI